VRLGIHHVERIIDDLKIVRHTALHVGEVAVDLDAATFANKEAVANRSGTGSDKQALVVVLKIAMQNLPARTLVIRPFDDGIRETGEVMSVF